MILLKNTNLLGVDGAVLMANQKDAWTIGALCVQALLWASPQQPLSGDEKFARYTFAKRFANPELQITLSTEEVAELRTLIGSHYPINLVGAAYALLAQ